MNANYLHNACHETMYECPQFDGFEDDSFFDGYGKFGDIPKKGLFKTIQFWREHGELLWEDGYDDLLPDDVKQVFANIDNVIDKAIKEYCKKL